MPARETRRSASRRGAGRRARRDPQHAARRRARSARTSTTMSSAAGTASRAQLHELRAEGAFRDRRSARHDGFRGRREAFGRALRGAEGRARAAGAGAGPVHARPAHERAWLYRSEPAAAGARRGHVRHGAVAEVRGRPVPHRGRDFWLIPTAEVSLTNLVREAHPRRSGAADAPHRADAVLPLPRRARPAATRAA